MKKLLLTLFPLIAFVSALAQETKSELKTRFDVIRNETNAGANTKTRLANAFQELSDGSQSVFYLVAAGTDTYTATALNVDAYAGKYFVVQFPNTNTGSATLNVNSLGAVTLKKDGGVNLDASDIDAGDIHILAYDGTNFQVLSLGGGGGGTWGTITGTLSSQTDLQSALNAKAPLSSPTFTGVPAAPTATAGTNTTQIATTAFVTTAVAGGGVSDGDKGDITVTSSGSAWTIDNNVVTAAKMGVGSATALQQFRVNGGATAIEAFTPTFNPMTGVGDLIQGTTAGAPQRLASAATGNVLLSGGVGSLNSWGPLPLSTHVTGRLAYANLTQGSALSVLGVTGNATGDHASIAAGSDHQVLRRSGTALTFGAVNLAQSAAVTGTLPIANGGTGSLNGTGLVISTKTGAYTIVTSDLVILGDATSAAFTVTLPTAASASGYEFVVKKIDSSVNAVTVDPNGAELIDGAATYALSAQWKYVRFKSNGTAWYIIANN